MVSVVGGEHKPDWHCKPVQHKSPFTVPSLLAQASPFGTQHLSPGSVPLPTSHSRYSQHTPRSMVQSTPRGKGPAVKQHLLPLQGNGSQDPQTSGSSDPHSSPGSTQIGGGWVVVSGVSVPGSSGGFVTPSDGLLFDSLADFHPEGPLDDFDLEGPLHSLVLLLLLVFLHPFLASVHFD